MVVRKEAINPNTRAENAAIIVKIGKTKKMKGKRSDNEHVPNEQIFSIVVSGRPVATALNDCRTADFLEQSELSNMSLVMNEFGIQKSPLILECLPWCHSEKFPSRVLQSKT